MNVRVRPSHHTKLFASLLTSTLVHKNSKLGRFLAFLSLYASTQFLEHIPTDDGITDSILGSIDFGTNTGGINWWLSPISKLGLPSPPTNPSNSQMGRVCTCWSIPMVQNTGDFNTVSRGATESFSIGCLSIGLSWWSRRKLDEAKKLVFDGIDPSEKKKC